MTDQATLDLLKISQEQLDALEAQNKKVWIVKAQPEPDGDIPWAVIFRRPKSVEFKRFRAQLNDEATQNEALEILLRQVIVHPGIEESNTMLNDFPGIPSACAPTLFRISGMTGKEGK